MHGTLELGCEQKLKKKIKGRELSLIFSQAEKLSRLFACALCLFKLPTKIHNEAKGKNKNMEQRERKKVATTKAIKILPNTT